MGSGASSRTPWGSVRAVGAASLPMGHTQRGEVPRTNARRGHTGRGRPPAWGRGARGEAPGWRRRSQGRVPWSPGRPSETQAVRAEKGVKKRDRALRFVLITRKRWGGSRGARPAWRASVLPRKTVPWIWGWESGGCSWNERRLQTKG